MILYSKSGDFIGIGKDELSFLGYEDLDEFKNVHKDVADMFINRPGYIFKFKNFSWIDYTLHSGAPKKSVIIKLKNGNEVEVPIKIKEIFLYNSENNEIQYAVEFSNTMQNSPVQQSESSFIQATPTYNENIIKPQEEPKDYQELSLASTEHFEENVEDDFSIDYNTTLAEDKPQMKLKANEDIFNKESFEKNAEEDFNLKLSEDEPELKLKTSETIFEKEEINETSNDISIDDFKDQTTNIEFLPKNDLDESKSNVDEDFILEDEILPSSEELSEDYTPELKEEPLIQIKKDETENITLSTDLEENESDLDEKIEFDLFNCAEELGLDISTIAEVIEEYIEKVNKSIPDIKSDIEADDTASLQNNIYKLKGISDNLRIMQFSKALTEILKAENKELKEKELNKFEKIVTQFKGELI